MFVLGHVLQMWTAHQAKCDHFKIESAKHSCTGTMQVKCFSLGHLKGCRLDEWSIRHPCSLPRFYSLPKYLNEQLSDLFSWHLVWLSPRASSRRVFEIFDAISKKVKEKKNKKQDRARIGPNGYALLLKYLSSEIDCKWINKNCCSILTE